MAGKGDNLLLFLIVLSALLSLSGCGKGDEPGSCGPNESMVGDRCCPDMDNNTVCDDSENVNATNLSMPRAAVCGNGICDNETENCTTCWKDCGACKQVVYVYIPRNFTLEDFTNELNGITRDGIKFRKDITALNTVSNLFYYRMPAIRTMAEFLGIRYAPLKESAWFVLGGITNEDYLVNGSSSLFRYVNYTNWYIIHKQRLEELAAYETRISSNSAKNDYPTPPTGYQKAQRYLDWEFRNYTKREEVIYDNVTVLDNGMVESIYAGFTYYTITYKSGEYIDKMPKADDRVVDQFTKVDEKSMPYIHALSFVCSRDLVVTIYDYDYSENFYSLNRDDLETQIRVNRADLIKRADRIKAVCDSNYRRKVFTYE
jgi:hypothetical protein